MEAVLKGTGDCQSLDKVEKLLTEAIDVASWPTLSSIVSAKFLLATCHCVSQSSPAFALLLYSDFFTIEGCQTFIMSSVIHYVL